MKVRGHQQFVVPVALGFVALGISACELPASEPFPTYSGVYNAVDGSDQVTLRIHEPYLSDDENLGGRPRYREEPLNLESFPLEFNTPRELEIHQHVFNRSNGVNRHRVTVLSKGSGDLDGTWFTAGLNADGWTSISLSADIDDYHDPDSPLVNPAHPEEGYACRWDFWASMKITVSPSPRVLDSAYPVCAEKLNLADGSELCVQARSWTDVPVADIGWGSPGNPVEILVEITLGRVGNPAFMDICRQPNYELVRQIRYRRQIPIASGDPRIRDNPEVDAAMTEASAGYEEDVFWKVLERPDSAFFLVPLFAGF